MRNSSPVSGDRASVVTRYDVVGLPTVGIVTIHEIVRHHIVTVIDYTYLLVEVHGVELRFLLIKRIVAVFHDAAFR
mgnify:CR=1 FL=1